MPSSKGSSQPRDWTQGSCIAGGFFTIWATRESGVASIKFLVRTPLYLREMGNAGTLDLGLFSFVLQNISDNHPLDGSVGTQSIHVNAFRGMVSIRDNNVLSEWDGVLDYKNVRCRTRSLQCQRKPCLLQNLASCFSREKRTLSIQASLSLGSWGNTSLLHLQWLLFEPVTIGRASEISRDPALLCVPLLCWLHRAPEGLWNKRAILRILMSSNLYVP